MHVKSLDNVRTEEPGPGVRIQWAISGEDGAGGFYMRIVCVEADAVVPPVHSHPWEHEIYIISGHGLLFGERSSASFKAGDVIYIPPDEPHQLIQEEELRFVCVIPAHQRGDKTGETTCTI
jgi:quercetin dioxygenase-like cupin family protein